MREVYVLKSDSDHPRNSFVINPKCRDFSVGRKSCSYCINDASISRYHAYFSLDSSGTLNLKDNSKFGTYVNAKPLTKGITVKLKNGDTVQFANYQARFKVCREQMRICVSNLSKDERSSLKKLCLQEEIEICNNIDDSFHYLVMSNITATLKVFSALMLFRQIVTPKFILNIANDEVEYLSIADYAPQFAEEIVDRTRANLDLSPLRLTLLKDLKFLFMDELHMKTMEQLLKFGGADCILYEKLNKSARVVIFEELQSGNNIIVFVKSRAVLNDLKFEEIQGKLEETSKRAVTDCELGFCILYCDRQNYCNPRSKIPSELADMTVTQPMVSESAVNSVGSAPPASQKVLLSSKTVSANQKEVKIGGQNEDRKSKIDNNRTAVTSGSDPRCDQTETAIVQKENSDNRRNVNGSSMNQAQLVDCSAATRSESTTIQSDSNASLTLASINSNGPSVVTSSKSKQKSPMKVLEVNSRRGPNIRNNLNNHDLRSDINKGTKRKMESPSKQLNNKHVKIVSDLTERETASVETLGKVKNSANKVTSNCFHGTYGSNIEINESAFASNNGSDVREYGAIRDGNETKFSSAFEGRDNNTDNARSLTKSSFDESWLHKKRSSNLSLNFAEVSRVSNTDGEPSSVDNSNQTLMPAKLFKLNVSRRNYLRLQQTHSYSNNFNRPNFKKFCKQFPVVNGVQLTANDFVDLNETNVLVRKNTNSAIDISLKK